MAGEVILWDSEKHFIASFRLSSAPKTTDSSVNPQRNDGETRRVGNTALWTVTYCSWVWVTTETSEGHCFPCMNM